MWSRQRIIQTGPEPETELEPQLGTVRSEAKPGTTQSGLKFWITWLRPKSMTTRFKLELGIRDSPVRAGSQYPRQPDHQV